MRKIKIGIRDIVTVILTVGVLFQDALQTCWDIFRNVDEVLFCVMALGIIFYCLSNLSISRRMFEMLSAIIVLTIVGIMGNMSSNIERSNGTIIQDIIYLTRVFVCYIGATLAFNGNDNRAGALCNQVATIVRLTIYVAFMCLLKNLLIPDNMLDGYRYGLPCYKFVYSSAGMLSQYCVFFLVILTADLEYGNNQKSTKIAIALLFIIWLFTFRVRGWVIIMLWTVLIIWNRHKTEWNFTLELGEILRVLGSYRFICVGVVTVAIAYRQILHYFSDGVTTARGLLLRAGFQIMWKYFPIGAGFGTYGTEVAKVEYSPLYYEYGLNKFWALKEGGSELTDCYWPAVAAELGIVGLVIIVFIIYKMFSDMLEQVSGRKYMIIAVLTFILSMLISSTVTGAFAAYNTSGFIVILVAIIKSQKQEEVCGYNSFVRPRDSFTK